MIAIVSNEDGFAGIHQTFLSPGGLAKAQVKKQKTILGKDCGGAIRMAAKSDILHVAEGIETGLSVMSVFPDICLYVAMSSSMLQSLKIPAGVREVHCWMDKDKYNPKLGCGAGEYAIRKLAQNVLYPQNIKLKIYVPPLEKGDWNDVLVMGGADHALQS